MTAPSLEESYRYAARLTRTTARNFAYSFWFLTPERRRSIAAVYAYSRRLDDTVDAAEAGAEGLAAAREGLKSLGRLLEGPADDQAAFKRVICSDGGIEVLTEARAALARAEPFDVPSIEAALRDVVENRHAKPGKVFQPVRVAIAGTTVSPGIFESIELLGREETLARIDRALERAKSNGD